MENYFDKGIEPLGDGAYCTDRNEVHELPFRLNAPESISQARGFFARTGLFTTSIAHLILVGSTGSPKTISSDRKRSEYFAEVAPDNIWVAAAQKNRRRLDPPVVTSTLCSLHVVERGANLFPLYLSSSQASLLQEHGPGDRAANISASGKNY